MNDVALEVEMCLAGIPGFELLRHSGPIRCICALLLAIPTLGLGATTRPDGSKHERSNSYPGASKVVAKCIESFCVEPRATTLSEAKKRLGKIELVHGQVFYRLGSKGQFLCLSFSSEHSAQTQLESVVIGPKDYFSLLHNVDDKLLEHAKVLDIVHAKSDTGIAIGDSEKKVLKIHGTPWEIFAYNNDPKMKRAYGLRRFQYSPDPDDLFGCEFGIENGIVKYISVSESE